MLQIPLEIIQPLDLERRRNGLLLCLELVFLGIARYEVSLKSPSALARNGAAASSFVFHLHFIIHC